MPALEAVDRRAGPTGGPASRRSRFLRRAPDLIAAIAALLGVLSLVDAFLPHERFRVHAVTRVIPVPATAAASAVLAVAGLLLLRVAAGLRKRKRRAWQVAMVVALVMLVALVVRAERRPDELAITALLIGLLIAARSRFSAKADPFSRWFAARVFVEILCVAYVYGFGILYLYPHRIVGQRSFTLRLEEVSLGLVGTPGNLHFASDLFADVLHGTLLGFGLFAVAAPALLLLRAP